VLLDNQANEEEFPEFPVCEGSGQRPTPFVGPPTGDGRCDACGQIVDTNRGVAVCHHARSRSKPDRVTMLRGLANFFDRWPEYRVARGDDAFDPALGHDEVQRDLRELADELEAG
jgi:hypothetical protein